MQEEDITLESLPDEAELTPPAGQGAGSEVAEIKDVLSELLGKKFPDDETALKAVKDTFSYVGKAGQELKELRAKAQQPAENVDPNKFVSREEFLKASFYSENPEYKPYKSIIDKFGSNPSEVVKEFAGFILL